MKKLFIIALAIVCTQGIWAQTDSITVQDELRLLKESLTPTVGYEKFQGKCYQEQSLIFAPMASNASDIDISMEGFENFSEDSFDEASDDADPGTAAGLSLGYLRTFIWGTPSDQGWKPNTYGTALNLGMLVDYKKFEATPAYSLLAIMGVEFGHFHQLGCGFNLIGGFGETMGFVYDMDSPNEDPVPETASSFKYGGEFWVRLMAPTEKGIFAKMETRIFVRILHSLASNEYDTEYNTYYFSLEKSVNVGAYFIIPF